MADEKLSELTEITSLAQDDLVYVVDASDTTDGAAGSSRAIQVGNLPVASGRTFMVKDKLGEIENLTAGEFDFNNIPAGYDRLIIKGSIQSDTAAGLDYARCWLNEDLTATTYHRQNHQASNGSANNNEGADNQIAPVPDTTSPAGGTCDVEIAIEDYAGSNLKAADVAYTTYAAADNVNTGATAIVSAVTAPVTRVRIRADNDPTDQLLGKLAIYGEKEETVGGSYKAKSIVAKTKIAKITNATAGEFDFDNIPGGYDRLIIEGALRGDKASTSDGVYCIFNTDTTIANYYRQATTALDASISTNEASTPKVGQVSAASSPSGVYSPVRFVLENYADPNKVKNATGSVSARRDTGQAAIADFAMWHDSMTAAITRLRFRSEGYATDQLFGELTLYGEKEESLAASAGSGASIIATEKIGSLENLTAGEFDFDNIPGDYDRLIIKGHLRSDVTSSTDVVFALFNGDTTAANYHRQNHYSSNGAGVVTEGSDPRVGVVTGASSPAEAYGSFHLTLEDYAGSKIKTAAGVFALMAAATNVATGRVAMSHDSMTAAITRLRIRTDNHATDQLLGKLELYGQREVTIGGGKVEIASITNSTAGEFDFNNIPAGFRRLIIEGDMYTDENITNAAAEVIFNAETILSNYHRQIAGAADQTTAVAEAASPQHASVPGASSPSGASVTFRMVIENYAGSRVKQATVTFTSYEGPTTVRQGTVGVVCKTLTAAVTRLRIRVSSQPTYGLIGTLTLYGES